MKLKIIIKLMSLFVLLSFYSSGYSQPDSLNGIPKLRQLINDEKIIEAQAELEKQINQFTATENYDTLVNYIEFAGSFSLSGNNWDVALSKAVKLGNKLLKLNDPTISTRTLKELAWIYDEAGKPDLSYKSLEEALTFANQLQSKKTETVADIIYNMGYYASETGNISLSKKHYMQCLEMIGQLENQDYVFAQQINNSLGGAMWREGKLDSCNYYFNKSLEALKQTDDLPINKFYRPSLVYMNMAVISNLLGKNNEAVTFSENAIKGFQSYINTETDEQKKNAAKTNQLIAVDNLGVFYNAIGDYRKAENLINYSYEEKKKIMTADAPRIVISKIILAQAKINTRDFDGAAKLLDESLYSIDSGEAVQSYWHSSALITRARIYEQNKNIEQAAGHYHKGENKYRQALNGNYNEAFLHELNNMAIFYAKNGNKQKARELANETYNAVQKSDFKNTRQELINLVAIADIYYHLEDYENAINFSNKALIFNYNNSKLTEQDSVLFEFNKPRAILINAKSKYQLQPEKSEIFLNQLLAEIEKGLKILEQRTSIINSIDNLNQLLTENSELIHFAKKIRLELYYLTKNKAFLADLLKLHESSVYNRIRARFNIKNEIKFGGIPESIVQRETFLKENLTNSLLPEKNTQIKTFIEANKKLELFLDSVELYYPKYYKMRYATLAQSIDNLNDITPKNTAIIRYLFIEKELYAFVISASEQDFFKLNFENGNEKISHISKGGFEVNEINSELHELYVQLWQPFAEKITSENIIIIPDGVLFNLSFETLTKNKIAGFGELATKSLLAKYNISYNYSLLLLNENQKTIDYSNNFVAFAPEFTHQMKKEYVIALSDSLSIDKTYLTLLSQPFSADLVKEYSRVFKGTSFLNEKASKLLFTNVAKEHKIIHIGTHAESNNISPELSRLIFAKNAGDLTSINDNSLYAYEIYDQNLSSNIAILTACETGKPAFQAGEGMISLAHAFNYAGSESILTSLWQIDEQSSTEIIELFYNYIARGLPKDKALRQAKLDYISTAVGRTISPQYWAGLVLIGDASPIEITSSKKWVLWLVLGMILIGAVVYFFRRKSILSI